MYVYCRFGTKCYTIKELTEKECLKKWNYFSTRLPEFDGKMFRWIYFYFRDFFKQIWIEVSINHSDLNGKNFVNADNANKNLPDDFEFIYNSVVYRYKMIGNSVHVRLACHLANAIKIFFKEWLLLIYDTCNTISIIYIMSRSDA